MIVFYVIRFADSLFFYKVCLELERGAEVVDILILGDYSLVVSFVFSAPFMR